MISVFKRKQSLRNLSKANNYNFTPADPRIEDILVCSETKTLRMPSQNLETKGKVQVHWCKYQGTQRE